MSMSEDSQDFGSLRRLLALKRHEQPPPGYFNDFSGHVINRIKAGDRVDDGVLTRLFWEAPWFQRLWVSLETKPILAGAFGTAVCVLLIWGVIYSEKADSEKAGVQPVATLAKPETPATSSVLIAGEAASDEPLSANRVSVAYTDQGLMGSSFAAAEPSARIFDLVPKPTKSDAVPTTLRLNLSGGY